MIIARKSTKNTTPLIRVCPDTLVDLFMNLEPGGGFGLEISVAFFLIRFSMER